MDKTYLPLGSVVVLKGSTKKMMIISRAMATQLDQGMVYFDYGACLFPEGLLGDKVFYFNQEDILQTIHEGFVNEDEKLMQENIRSAVAQSKIARGDFQTIKKNENK